MTDLEDLLEAARAAAPGERIELRNPIAARGGQALPAMRNWLRDPELGAFAVRVLSKIAEDGSQRAAVLAALTSVDSTELSQSVARDVADALGRIRGAGHGAATRTGQPRGARIDAWPRSRSVSRLELQFHDAMLDIFRLAGEATRKQRPDGSVIRGYWASYFLRGVRNHGGPNYARQLLRAEGTTEGFQRLTDEHRLDLTMEALVLKPEFGELFAEDERSVAAHRLARAGYQPSRGM